MTDPCPETLEEVYGSEMWEEPQPVKPEVVTAPPPAPRVKEAANTAVIDELEGIHFSQLTKPLPDEENPNALLAGGFMRKGHAVFLSAPSGTGKSSISVQLAFAWACGREMLGLRPARALKICFLQSEDDNDDMYKFKDSVLKGFREKLHWPEEDLKLADANIHWVRKNASGKDFVNLLVNIQGYHQEKHQKPFDMFIVNPFLNYVGGDASDNTYLRELLRDQLDPVIKGDIPGKPWTKCGLFFIHHFTKPPSAQARGSFGIDEYAHYAALGGSDLTNWQRGTLTIAPIMNKELRKTGYEYYWLAAPKRGKRLDWPRCPLKEAPSIPARLVRHANNKLPDEKGMIFWFDVPIGEGPNKAANDNEPTVEGDAECLAGMVRKRFYGATELRSFAEKFWQKSTGAYDKKRGRAAYEYFVDHYKDYGLEMQPGDNNSKTYGTPEDLKRLL